MKKSVEILKGMIVFAITLFVVVTAVLFFAQDRLIFPAPDIAIPQIQDADFQQVAIPTPDGETLFSLHHPAENDEATILVFHGNGDAAIYQKSKGNALVAAGFGVLLAEYRGYPGSTGYPSETGLFKDGLAAYDYIAAQKPGKIGAYAHSLGTGIAIKLASEREVFSLVLESPFDSILALAQKSYPWLPVSLLLKHKFRSDFHIKNVAAPILIMHGDKDTVIPIEHGRRLHQNAAAGTPFIVVENAGHNNLLEFGTIEKAVEFLRQNLK